MSFGLKVIGLRALTSRFKAAQAKSVALKRKMNSLAIAQVFRWVSQNFRGQGSPVGGWKPLDPKTIALRRKGGGSGSPKILIDTGLLRNNWQQKSDDRGGSLVSGTDYGIIHDEGKGAPQRRILPKRKEIAPILRKIYQKGVMKLLKEARV